MFTVDAVVNMAAFWMGEMGLLDVEVVMVGGKGAGTWASIAVVQLHSPPLKTANFRWGNEGS